MTAPNTETTDLEEALGHLCAEPAVWVRVAAVKNGDGCWIAGPVELTSGCWPPSWEQRTWEYTTALFVADVQSGADIVTGLRAGMLKTEGFDIALPDLTTSPRWERRQSQSAGLFEALEWPSTETELSVLRGANADPPGHMLSDSGTPSFVSYYAAASYFFLVDHKPVGGQVQRGLWYRHQDLRGRINRVIADGVVEIEVEGSERDDLVVELPGSAPGPHKRIWRRYGSEPEVVRFLLTDRLPPETWVLLRKGAEWLDRRFMHFPYARGNEAGIEIVVDAGTRLESLLASRERQTVEFKRQLPKDDESKGQIMKTVCAFANSDGGSVIVGVDDDRVLFGVETSMVDRLRDQLTQMVGSWVEPRPITSFEVLPISDSDKVVLELRVEPGTGLYGSGRPSEVRTVYVRHHGITERATPAEIAAIVHARRIPVTPVPWTYQ